MMEERNKHLLKQTMTISNQNMKITRGRPLKTIQIHNDTIDFYLLSFKIKNQ